MKRVTAAVERAGRRWDAMSPEEREAFRKRVKLEKCLRAADEARKRVSGYTRERRQELERSARKRMDEARHKRQD